MQTHRGTVNSRHSKAAANWLSESLPKLQNIQFIKRPNVYHLFYRIHHNIALDAALPNIRPAVARRPLSLALRTLEFTKAALHSLIRCQTFFTWSRLQKKHINNIAFQSKAEHPRTGYTDRLFCSATRSATPGPY